MLDSKRGKMDWILRNPVHFWNISDEKILVAGSVLLTRSEGCKMGLGMEFGVMDDGGNG